MRTEDGQGESGERAALEAFERQLRQALVRCPAPPSLKRRLVARVEWARAQRRRSRVVLWQRLAASVLAAAVVGGGLTWRYLDEQRRGREAREQVLTALRITGRALNQMNQQLTERNRPEGQ